MVSVEVKYIYFQCSFWTKSEGEYTEKHQQEKNTVVSFAVSKKKDLSQKTCQRTNHMVCRPVWKALAVAASGCIKQERTTRKRFWSN